MVLLLAYPTPSFLTSVGVFASISAAKTAQDVGVPATSDLEGTESRPDFRTLVSLEAGETPYSVPDDVSSAVLKRGETPASRENRFVLERRSLLGVVRSSIRFTLHRAARLNIHLLPIIRLLWLVDLKGRVTHIVLHHLRSLGQRGE